MNVSSKSRYALTALVELDLRTGPGSRPLRAADLAAACDLPEKFLEQLLATLRQAGILRSQRGVGGGFSFVRPPDQISVFDIVAALDGPSGVAERDEGDRTVEADRGASIVWRQASAAFEGVLAGTSVADVAERERQLRAGQPMYQI